MKESTKQIIIKNNACLLRHLSGNKTSIYAKKKYLHLNISFLHESNSVWSKPT